MGFRKICQKLKSGASKTVNLQVKANIQLKCISNTKKQLEISSINFTQCVKKSNMIKLRYQLVVSFKLSSHYHLFYQKGHREPPVLCLCILLTIYYGSTHVCAALIIIINTFHNPSLIHSYIFN